MAKLGVSELRNLEPTDTEFAEHKRNYVGDVTAYAKSVTMYTEP